MSSLRQPARACHETASLRLASSEMVVWGVLLAGALALRLVGITTTSMWTDEAYTLLASWMDWSDLLLRLPLVENHPPLHYALCKLWGLAGDSLPWMRLLSVGFSLATVVYLARWARLFDRRAGLIAALLAATVPMLCHYAQENRPYALLYLLTAAGLFHAERFARGTSRGRGMLVSMCLAAWTLFIGFFSAVLVFTYWLLRAGRSRWSPRQIIRLVGWAALGTSPLIVLAAYHTLFWQRTGFWIPPTTGESLHEILRDCVGLTHVHLWQGDPTPPWRMWVGWVFGTVVALGMAIAVSAALRRRRRVDGPVAALLASGAVYAGLAVGMSVGVFPMLLDRVAFPVFVPVLGAMALSVSADRRPWLRRVGTVACISVATVWAVVWVEQASGGSARRPHDRAAFEYIAERSSPHDLVVIMPVPTFAAMIYLDGVLPVSHIHSTLVPIVTDTPRLRLLPRRGVYDPQWLERFIAHAEQQQRRHGGDHSVWLVDRGIDTFGFRPRRQLVEWLDAHYEAADEKMFGDRWWLGVTRYAFRDGVQH